MFVKGTSVSLKASASSLCNNLTVLSSKEKQSTTYGVVHKAFVCITNVTSGAVVNQKQVSCKGEAAHSSSAVLQVRSIGFLLRPDWVFVRPLDEHVVAYMYRLPFCLFFDESFQDRGLVSRAQ